MRFPLFKTAAGLLFMGAFVATASPWEETYLGLGRTALMDACQEDARPDPFSVTVNPAWVPRKRDAIIAVTTAAYMPFLPAGIAESTGAGLVGVTAARNFGRFRPQFSGIFVLGRDAVLDTGNAESRVDPWVQRSRRFQVQPGLSASFLDDALAVGVSVPVTFANEASADLNLNRDQPNARFRAGLRPDPSFIVGFRYAVTDSLDVSLAYRDREKAGSDVSLQGELPFTGGASIPIQAEGRSLYLFDPRRVTLQAAYRVSPSLKVGASLRWSDWSEMPNPLLDFRFTSPRLNTAARTFRAKDTWDAGAGLALEFAHEWSLLTAYRFQQAAFPGNAFYYDGSQSIVGLGINRAFEVEADRIEVSLSQRFHFIHTGGLYSFSSLGVGYRL